VSATPTREPLLKPSGSRNGRRNLVLFFEIYRNIMIIKDFIFSTFFGARV